MELSLLDWPSISKLFALPRWPFTEKLSPLVLEKPAACVLTRRESLLPTVSNPLFSGIFCSACASKVVVTWESVVCSSAADDPFTSTWVAEEAGTANGLKTGRRAGIDLN